MVSSPQPRTPDNFDTQRLGERIRTLRTERELSLRALSERIGISASALSQMERGKMRPSVTRLYQIMTELDVSMAAIFGADDATARKDDATTAPTPGAEPVGDPAARPPDGPPEIPDGLGNVAITRHADAATLELKHGVRYRRLTPEAVPGMNYFESVYPPGSCSSQNAEYVRHRGHEIGNVVSGTLTVDVGFDSYELGPGDSIMYPSTLPHRITNRGTDTAVAIWLNLG